MSKMTKQQHARVLEKQVRDWPIHLKGAASGNPYATLCSKCYGRHAPPNNEICPVSLKKGQVDG